MKGWRTMESAKLDAYAAMALEVGLNFQSGQDLAIRGHIEHAPFARAVAAQAYARGAHYVDIWYWDPYAKKARVEHAEESSLEWTPPWMDARYEYLTEHRGAVLSIAGDPAPDLLSGVDGRRAGLDRMPALESALKAQ